MEIETLKSEKTTLENNLNSATLKYQQSKQRLLAIALGDSPHPTIRPSNVRLESPSPLINAKSQVNNISDPVPSKPSHSSVPALQVTSAQSNSDPRKKRKIEITPIPEGENRSLMEEEKMPSVLDEKGVLSRNEPHSLVMSRRLSAITGK